MDGYEFFKGKKFSPESESIITTADEILNTYHADGYTLTLRQLYYQFVSRDLIPNTEKSYKRIGNIISDGRLAGLISWDGIEDRGRNLLAYGIEEDIDTILMMLPYDYKANFWGDQEYYVEVWVEKEALISVVQRAAGTWYVNHMACKGYMSQSEMHVAGKRLAQKLAEGKFVKIIHLGDHDPSGIDMTRDNGDRLSLFAREGIEVQRIALNMDQIEQYSPPPNPTKVTDSRADEYIAQYGHTSWELDALEPSVIVDLIGAAIEPLIDQDLWDQAKARQDYNRDLLRGVRRHWGAVSELIDGLG